MSAEPSPGRRRPTRDQTRRRVLDAARSVLAHNGIAATSINDIAAEAGLTKGAIYSSFASKDELVLAVMEEHLAERVDETTRVFDEFEDMQTAAAQAGMRLLQAVHDDATHHRLFLEYWGLAMRDETVHATLAKRRKRLREIITNAITEGARARGIELPLPVEEFVVAIMALQNGLVVEHGIDQNAVPQQLFSDVLALLVGLKPGSTG